MPWDADDENNSQKIKLAKEVVAQIIQNELTEPQQLVVTKRAQGMSVKDISEELGIASSTVSIHYRRGLNTLKKFGQYIAPFLR